MLERFLKMLIWCPEKFDTGFLRVRLGVDGVTWNFR